MFIEITTDVNTRAVINTDKIICFTEESTGKTAIFLPESETPIICKDDYDDFKQKWLTAGIEIDIFQRM